MNLIGAFSVVLAVFFHSSLAQYEVTTTSGEVIGSESAYEVDGSDIAVIEYLGIPYAQPPVGQNRFRAPVTVQTRPDPIEADSYGPSCPQDADQLDDILDAPTTTYEDFGREISVSEDCLYLNIYQPNTTSNGYAVMVYFHGGDFVSGTGMAYAGNVLTSLHEVIVVTVNYRLGAFGFLSDGTPTLPGNYGLMDQQKALEWIRQNIQSFGGNPDLVTIFGGGSGASSAHLHTIIEESSLYFRRAILQSASYDDAVWTRESAREQYEALLENLEINPDSGNVVEQLQSTTLGWEEIQAALPGPWRPVISDMIPVEPRIAMMEEGGNAGKDILVGSNNLDAYQIVTSNVDVTQPEWYREAVRDITDLTSEFNTWSEEDVDRRMLMFNQYYVGFGTDVEFFPPTLQNTMITRMYTDQLYGTWAHEIAMTRPVCSCNVYKYIFKRKLSTTDIRETWAMQFAAHEDELPFVFGFITEPRSGATDDEKTLSFTVMTMWTDFAKTGEIEGNVSVDQFSAYSSSDSCRSTIYLDIPGPPGSDTGVATRDDLPVARNWEFWKRYYVTLGFSCSQESSGQTTYSGDDTEQEDCEPGVWSDAGIEMSNELAGALLITFIVLTGVFMLAFLYSCHRWNKAKRKIKKIVGDEGSSVISNSSTRM